LVSGDPRKRREVGRKYRVDQTYSYGEYDQCLSEVDAVYIALPNSMHAEYTTRAAQAGVHVLCEKPMAVTVDECEAMIDACRQHRVKLMIAYRLHFEAINLAVIDLVRKGRIGQPKFFNSSFSLTVRDGNIRAKKSMGGGSLYDIGVYCINAARHIFRAEPKEVLAMAVNSGARRVREIDESTGALLRFDGERVAAFVTSFNAGNVGSYRVVGTKGRRVRESCLRIRRRTLLRTDHRRQDDKKTHR
jgi:Predicted dehydrogenases and related proteins